MTPDSLPHSIKQSVIPATSLMCLIVPPSSIGTGPPNYVQSGAEQMVILSAPLAAPLLDAVVKSPLSNRVEISSAVPGHHSSRPQPRPSQCTSNSVKNARRTIFSFRMRTFFAELELSSRFQGTRISNSIQLRHQQGFRRRCRELAAVASQL